MASAEVPLDMEARIREVMAKALKISAVPESARRGEFEPWDSLGHLLIIDGLETNFGLQISPEDAMSLDSIASIEGMLRKRLHER